MIDNIVQGGKYEAKFYVPTPSYKLNQSLRNGGIPSNAIVQIKSKDEGSFKSTISMQILANAQKMGLNVGFVDSEMAMDDLWAEEIGIDTDKWFYIQPTTGEIAWKAVHDMITKHDCKVVVLDSIDATQPEHLHESDIGEAHIGNAAKLHSKGIRQALPIIAKHDAIIIGINQMRVNITNMGPRGYISSGGRGWGFYSKLILDCKRSSASANKGRDIIDIDLYVEKNKLGKSFVTIPVKCKQGVGIMWQQDKLEELMDSGDLVKSGSWYRYKGEPIGQGDESALTWIGETFDYGG